MSPRKLIWAACAVLTGTAGIAFAGPTDETSMARELERLRAEVSRLHETQSQVSELRDEVTQLRTDSQRTWLNERRAEEVKTLIRDVLSDADTRASLMAGGAYAGHDGKHFFLASEDQAFLMEIAGQMQMRYIWNGRSDAFVDNDTVPGDGIPDGIDDTPIDENVGGFQIRRTKLNFSGHVGGPKLEYDITIAAERTGGTILLENFAISHKVADGVKVGGGQKKLPFLREELVSSKRQLAVDRSSVTEYFTLDRGQGVFIEVKPTDNIKLRGMISDGADSEGEDFNEDDTDIAFTGRADITLAGNSKQAKDFVAWRGEEFAAFAGGAVHYEVGETGTMAANTKWLLWTVDGLIENNGVSVMAAVNGLSTDTDAAGAMDYDDIGVLIQAGVMATDQLQPFVRYEYLDMDGFDEVSLITGGVNYYLNKHKAKVTVDVVYGLDPLREPGGGMRRRINSPYSDRLGLQTDDVGEDGQVAVRAQFQLVF